MIPESDPRKQFLRRRAKRTVEHHTSKKIGYRPEAEMCGNCELCRIRIAPRKKRGRQKMTRLEKTVWRTYEGSKGMKIQNKSVKKRYIHHKHYCLLARKVVNAKGVCDFHVWATQPPKSKEKIHVKARWTRRQQELLELLDKTVRQLDGGIPKRPEKPTTLKEIATMGLPKDVEEYVLDHWEKIADEVFRYNMALYEWRDRFSHQLQRILEVPSYYKDLCSKFKDYTITEYEAAYLKAQANGGIRPIWRWDEVLRKIKREQMLSARLQKRKTWGPISMQPPQEDAPQGD